MKTHKIGENMKEETRIALLEQSIGHINEALIRFEKRFDKIDAQFELLQNDMKFRFGSFEKETHKQFERLENKIERSDSKSDSRFIWLLSFGIGAFAGLFGMMAHAMHWF